MQKITTEIKKLQAKRDDEIAALFASGATYQKVAEMVGCSMTKVQDVIRIRGLQRTAQTEDPTAIINHVTNANEGEK